MNKQRLAAVLTALFLTFALLSGCAAGASGPSFLPHTGAPADASGSAIPGADTDTESDTGFLEDVPGYQSSDVLGETFALPGNVPPSKLPLSGEPVTLTFWDPPANASAGLSGLSDGEMWKEAFRRTNVQIRFIHPAATNVQESFTLHIASRDYADIIGETNLYIGGIDKAVTDGVFIDMNEWLEYIPHYIGLLDANKTIRRDCYTDGGRLGHFSILMYTDGEIVPNGMVYRKDLLDRSGLSLPETFDEWEQTLKYFRDRLEMPGALFLDPTGVYTFNSSLLLGLGITHDYILRGGKVEYSRITPEYRTYLEYMSDWYAEGFIFEDFYTYSNYYSAMPLCFQDEILMINGWSAFAGTMYADTRQAANPDFNLAAIRNPVLQKGELPIHRRYGTVDNITVYGYTGHAVSTKCPNTEIALRFLDYFYSSEGALLASYGPSLGERFDDEDATYYLGEGNRPLLTRLVARNDTLNLADSLAVYTWHMPPFNFYQREADGWTEDQKKTLDVWGAYDAGRETSVLPMNYSLTASEGNRISAIMSDIQTYVDEMTLKFILGDVPLSEYEAYAERVKSMGLQEALDLRQAAIDRYLGRGER